MFHHLLACTFNSICTFHHNFSDKSANIVRISPMLINLSLCFFLHSSSNCFLGSFLQSPVFIFGFFSVIFFISLYVSFFSYISSFTPLFHHHVFTLHFLFLLYSHTSSQTCSTPFTDPHKSWLLSDIMSLTLH